MDISPDGAWAAYVSRETGTNQVYVRQFPSGLGQQIVSTESGFGPRWSPDGATVYYRTQSTIMAAEVQLEPNFQVRETRVVLEGVRGGFDVHPDGERLVIEDVLPQNATTTGEAAPQSFVVVLNWFDEVRAALEAAGVG
jgi:WD40-like Beta Propeller Repeat